MEAFLGKKVWTSLPSAIIVAKLLLPRHARIVDGDILEKAPAARELNVYFGVALMGLRTGIISLAAERAGDLIKNRIRFVGVSDDYLTYDDDPRAHAQMSNTAQRRASRPSYDRFNASVCGLTMDDIPAEAFFPRGCSI